MEPVPPGRVIVITGASSGIGRALAIRAAKAGYAVFATGRNEGALAALAAEIGNAGGECRTLSADLGERDAPERIIDAAMDAFKRIDVLVNNAGMVARGPLVLQSEAALRAQFETHVIAPLRLTRKALVPLVYARGHVFMLGSGVARIPVGDLGAYPASKAALRSATTTLRRELRPFGIAVTYVDPGAVDTAFMKRAGMPGAPAWLLASPEEVAKRIFHAIGKRPREVNAVPWQTTFVALAERFPRLLDAVLERAPGLVGGSEEDRLSVDGLMPAPPDPLPAAEATPEAPAVPAAPVETTRAEVAPPEGFAFANDVTLRQALEPVAGRMTRLKLSESFVAGLLVEGARLEAGEVALRWAGMPNKNERAVTIEVLEALEAAGYLRSTGPAEWTVIRDA